MILGGVFERHPGLKLVMTEQWMDWAVQVIADMDGLYTGPAGAHLRKTLPRPPSEYFRENCFIGASFLSNWEAKLGIEHDLVANTMWGDDYPHAEGTWPHTREAMRFTFSDVEQRHVRQYLADTAIHVYDLDHRALRRWPPRSDRPWRRSPRRSPRRGRGARPLRLPEGPGILVSDVTSLRAVRSPRTRSSTSTVLGWVQLKAFVDPEVVRGVLELARQAMGDDADGNPVPLASSRLRKTASSASTTSTPPQSFGMSNPVLRPLVDDVGTSASLLQRRRRSR